MAADPASAAQLAELCGHLPLALCIAGARLAARPSWPLAALAHRLAEAENRLDELAIAGLTVRSSIDPSYHSLAEPARLALRRIGLLRARDFPSWALAALLDTPLPQAERLLDDLAAVHLVEPEGTRYRIHDLAWLYARERALKADPASARHAAISRLAAANLARRARGS